MTEAKVNLAHLKISAVKELEVLLKKIDIVELPEHSTLPSEITLVEKDRPILLAAISVKATHLLTSDKLHFGHFFGTRVEGVLILPPADYLNQFLSI